jgi:aminoglycoside phosphotransferase family enzyme
MRASSHATEDQSETIAFLAAPATHGGAAVERIDTHGSTVVLAGAFAYKLKRAVHYPYMDFSTLERRRWACEAELALNRHAAPELYLGVESIRRRADGTLALGGAGTPVDWVVKMRRFASEDLLDRRAAAGVLDAALALALADRVRRFHEDAERRFDQGGAEALRRVIAGNDEGLIEAGPGTFARAKVERLRQASDAALARVVGLLDARRDAGFVRRCHGDLHLGNICLWQGKPVPFDAVEFNDAIGNVDTLYDLAFLLMDLDRRALLGLANLLFNRYLAPAADAELQGLAALPLFLSARAGVRAQTLAASTAAQGDPATAAARRAEAALYLDLALGYLTPPAPLLVAIGGVSGTGKSTLARALAPRLGAVPGALRLASDGIRKRLLGREETARLGPESYHPDVTLRVYGSMRARAGAALSAGHAAVADAVHGRPEERRAIEDVARRARALRGALARGTRGFARDAHCGARERRVRRDGRGAARPTRLPGRPRRLDPHRRGCECLGNLRPGACRPRHLT